MATPLIPPEAFTSLATGNFEMLWQFFSKTATIAFFDVGANGIQTTCLLFYEFPTAITFANNFRIRPPVIKKLACQLVNLERFQTVKIAHSFPSLVTLQ